MKQFRIAQAIFILILALNLAACTKQVQSIPGISPSPVFQTGEPARIRLSLEHTPTGTATFRWNSMSEELTVALSVIGLTPGSRHLAHIHTGTCAHTGSIVYQLQAVVADAHGIGLSTTTLHHITSGIPLRGWSVNIHNGSTFATALDARAISCGDVSPVPMRVWEMQFAHAILSATISPDEHVHGTALFRIMDHVVIVTLSLSGLAANTMHMAHIHSGTCASQGPVLYPLQPVVADAQGFAMTMSTIQVNSPPPLHWYINVHEAGTPTAMMTPQGFTPIVCGDGVSIF